MSNVIRLWKDYHWIREREKTIWRREYCTLRNGTRSNEQCDQIVEGWGRNPATSCAPDIVAIHVTDNICEIDEQHEEIDVPWHQHILPQKLIEQEQEKWHQMDCLWRKDLSVIFETEDVEWNTFSKNFIMESSKLFSNIPKKIKEGRKSNPLNITWWAFILKNNNYAKCSLLFISSEYSFQNWMSTNNKSWHGCKWHLKVKRHLCTLICHLPSCDD
jgi:hypothetical protein